MPYFFRKQFFKINDTLLLRRSFESNSNGNHHINDPRYWLKIIVSIKTYLVTTNEELLILWILQNIVESFSGIVSFEKDVTFHSIIKRLQAWSLFTRHLKAHKLVQQGCFFFHYSLATSMTNWALIFTGVLFYAYVDIHQVRIQVYCLWHLPNMSMVPLNYVK